MQKKIREQVTRDTWHADSWHEDITLNWEQRYKYQEGRREGRENVRGREVKKEFIKTSMWHTNLHVQKRQYLNSAYNTRLQILPKFCQFSGPLRVIGNSTGDVCHHNNKKSVGTPFPLSLSFPPLSSPRALFLLSSSSCIPSLSMCHVSLTWVQCQSLNQKNRVAEWKTAWQSHNTRHSLPTALPLFVCLASGCVCGENWQQHLWEGRERGRRRREGKEEKGEEGGEGREERGEEREERGEERKREWREEKSEGEGEKEKRDEEHKNDGKRGERREGREGGSCAYVWCM